MAKQIAGLKRVASGPKILQASAATTFLTTGEVRRTAEVALL